MSKLANVHHAHLWGDREIFDKVEHKLIDGKYRWLAENDIKTTEWTKVEPQVPFYLFIPQDNILKEEYEQGYKVTDILSVNSVGIVTARDALTIHWDRDELWKTVTTFALLPVEEARSEYNLGKDARDWKVPMAQEDLRSSGPSKDKIKSVLYRPFDVRYTYYTGVSRGFQFMPRNEVMRHMIEEGNIAIVTSRMTKGEDFKHTQVTRNITEVICMSPNTSNNGFVFPLYLYPNPKQKTLLDTQEPSTAPGGRRPNLSPAFIAVLSEKLALRFVPDGKGDLQETFGPEDVFDYMYAVFHAPTYRARYAEFLKIDFPRLPLTSDIALFRALCGLGQRLVALHLMEAYSKTVVPSFPIKGNNIVEKVEYQDPSDANGQIASEGGRVYINKTQYFGGVPSDVWAFHVGGYQVCHKWLKDRKGRTLTFADVQHYQRIVGALAETIQLMEQVDEAIEEHGGWPVM
ncbi:MAG: hypothetical protein NVS2B2_36430 [Ktedonobacteraceae bacterium]